LERLLIVGIDPGTTKSYAVLDLHGNILEVKSNKKLTFEMITKEIFKFGNPILIGTDIKKVPNFVERIGSSFGAKIFRPEINLQGNHKTKLVKKFLKKKDFEVKNKHENDALISAILAYKNIKPLLHKIESKYPKLNTEEIKNSVLKENINIKRAISLLED
jgi:predicted RNase H-like nuclease (RuvC/YqgF family)